ncbi:SPOR domain-containing protein [Dyadobacter sp. CY345]|uniref:HU domain-containing protein n=1 Tax=Dyadobacter sp. CY345 TaxID=2909335 RepID=UPI001F48459E|nr:SPOR domain-containing protein [Dyadobacter sp. CY345]MCF2446506.1 SPOR domain-containing protein [Dyadobacter sp. CY345]
MIAVETVIRKLVSDYEFVIIPGFGALLSHKAQASFNAETGVFSPPNKWLAFNEFLKLDDGLLANYISRHEQVAHTDAVAHVRNYTDQLRSSLKSTEHAIIEGVGEFSTNGEGKLVFEPNTDKYFKNEWYGFRSTPAKMVEKKAAVIAMPVVDLHEEHVEVLEENEAKTFKVNWIGWASAAMIAGIMCYFSLFFVSGSGENKSTLNPFTSLFEETSNSAPEKETKKPAVTAERGVVNVTKKASVDPIRTEIPVEKIEPVAIKTADVKVELAAKPIVSSSKRFYLIAGTFKGSKQANVLLTELKEKGYSEALIIDANKYSKKFKVSVGGFENESEAYKANSKLKKVIGGEGWVYKSR